MKYDDASWHAGGEFPEDQPEEHGGTHIALFLKWCLCKGWAGSIFTDPELLEQVAKGRVSATEFFFEHCDGKLVDVMLNEPGNAFTQEYYGDDGLYLEDYTLHFGDLMYVAPDTAHDFSKFSAILDDRLKSGVLRKSSAPNSKIPLSGKKPSKPWWKLW